MLSSDGGPVPGGDVRGTTGTAPSPECTLTVTTARTDLPFLEHTLRHLSRAFRYPFARRMVVADVNTVTGSFLKRPTGTVEGLLQLLEQLRQEGVIDEVLPVDATPELVRETFRQVFSKETTAARDYRGAPILNYILSLTRAPTRYVVHVDADMLIYQAPDVVPWVRRGIELLQSSPEVGAVLPLSGPPSPDGTLRQALRRGDTHELDPRGFYRFRGFTSRIFLIDRERIEGLYPIDPAWPSGTSVGRRMRNALRTLQGRQALPTWERMMERTFQKRGLVRADLSGNDAWSLHPLARGESFVQRLPRIIADVEAGRFPPEQAGFYDLQFEAWSKWQDGP